MKRSIAVALTIIILAAIAVCFLRPGDPNPDFGNVPEVCRPYNWVEITDCTGDTDVMTAEEVQWLRSEPGWVVVRLRASKDVFLSPTRFAGGAAVDDVSEPYGMIEKLFGGEWQRISDMTPHWADISETSLGVTPPYTFVPGLLATDNPSHDETMDTFRIKIPEYEPGATYRFTYLFREMAQEYPRESGDELYSISHTVTIPEATEKRFDLVSLGINEHSPRSGGIRSFSVEPIIRVNDGDAPYTHYAETTFEKLVNGRWVTSLGSSDTFWSEMPEVLGKQDFRRLEVYQYRREDLSNYYTLDPYLDLYISDASADYRLTLVFCENEDGSGERYTLTLNLRFEE